MCCQPIEVSLQPFVQRIGRMSCLALIRKEPFALRKMYLGSLRGIVGSILSNLSCRITRRNRKRPAEPDSPQPKPDKVVLEAVPKMVPQKSKCPVLLSFLHDIGG
jgi:hypothetical protein